MWAHQHRIGTRRGRRAATVRTQAKLALRLLRDDARLRVLAAEAGIGISTAYRYLHEGITVIADHAPDLHQVLAHGHQEGWSHVCLDGTLINTDRVAARAEAGHHLWYSGKHKTHGANVQIIADPTGFPVWSAPAEPGSVHDLTAARQHSLGALYAAAPTGLPTLADKGYDGTHAGIHTPVKGRNLAEPNTTYNTLHTALRALGERANAELNQRWRCLRRIRLCPHRTGDIVAATIVRSTLRRGNY